MKKPDRNAQRLDGQRALVTGANSGIGAAIARGLARAGATVVVNYVANPTASQTLVKEIEAEGARALAIRADVSEEDQVEGMFGEAIERLGDIEILVNNAGIQRDGAIQDLSLDDWNRVIAVNLTGQFLCARAAARHFIQRGVVPEVSCSAGKIVCVSSVHDRIPWAGHANYAASKGGVMLLMMTLAQELGPYKVRVNSVSPGAIKTPINRPAWDTPQAEAELLQLIPYGRVGEVEDIARAVVWLASDESDYVTGATLYIDGGMTLYPSFREAG